jgi:hypothetical protein
MVELKNIPSWLKGGLTAEIVLVICIILGSLGFLSSIYPRSCILPDVIGVINPPVWCTLFFSSYWVILTWFLVGAIIGWIIGKIKSSKKK